MTGITQNLARKSGIAVDSLELKFEILDEPMHESDTMKLFEAKDDETLLLYGLYLDGARWNFERKIITDSNKRFDLAPTFRCKTVKVRLLV